MRVVVIHGDPRLRKEIDNFCSDCSKHRSLSDWCYIKNQKACKIIQAHFGKRIHGEQKDEYQRHENMITVWESENDRFGNIEVANEHVVD